MASSSIIKVVAAFVAGIIIALGSALVYVRATDTVGTQPVARSLPAAEAPPNPPADDPAVSQPPAPLPVEEAASRTTPAVSPAPKKIVHAKRSTRPAQARKAIPIPVVHHPADDRVQIAQAKPIAPPADVAPSGVSSAAAQRSPQPITQPVTRPSTQPSRAVNEESYHSGPQLGAPPYSPEPRAAPHVVTLQAGTPLVVRLAETLSTDHNYTGDTFRGTLEEPIIMNGFIIADRGSKILGRVISAQAGSRMQGGADLNVTVTEINTTDGQRVRIQTNSVGKRGPNVTRETAAKIAGGAAIGAIIGAIAGGGRGAAIGAGAGGAAGSGWAMSSHGRPAVIPTEATLTFNLAAPVTITERINN